MSGEEARTQVHRRVQGCNLQTGAGGVVGTSSSLSLSLSPSVLLVLFDAKVLALYDFQNLLPLHRMDPRHQ